MFQAVVQRAQRAVDSTLAKLVTRAAVAVPLVIAAGFGTAALTVTLTDTYGPALSYTIMAGLFVVLGGIVAALMSSTNGSTQEPETEEAPSVVENVAEVAAPLLDRDTLIALLTTAGPVALPGLLRIAARNLPLLVAAVIVAFFFFGRSVAGDEPGAADAATKPQPAE
jgi:hypothetical protein